MKVKCPKCSGCGEIVLPPHLQSTLDFVKANPGTTATEASQVLAPAYSINAMNNRLADLEELGLIHHTRDKRQYFWHAK